MQQHTVEALARPGTGTQELPRLLTQSIGHCADICGSGRPAFSSEAGMQANVTGQTAQAIGSQPVAIACGRPDATCSNDAACGRSGCPWW
jgi:hypothetical protein